MTKATGTEDRVRRRYNRDAEVLEAAIKVFWTKGFAAATIQDIADEVGVLKGSLYHYVQSKEDLLLRIFTESSRQAAEIEAAVLTLELPALQALREYFVRYTSWYLDNVERVALYTREWRSLTGERLAEVKRQRRSIDAFVMRLIGDAQVEGALPSALNVRHAAYFVLGGINSLPDWYRRNRPGSDAPEQIADTYASFVMAALTGWSER